MANSLPTSTTPNELAHIDALKEPNLLEVIGPDNAHGTRPRNLTGTHIGGNPTHQQHTIHM